MQYVPTGKWLSIKKNIHPSYNDIHQIGYVHSHKTRTHLYLQDYLELNVPVLVTADAHLSQPKSSGRCIYRILNFDLLYKHIGMRDEQYT